MAAIRGWSSSSCAARWTASPPWRRWAIPIMPACTGRSRWHRAVRTPRSSWICFFALHPAMPEFARMYREKHAAVVHAVATPYRERSHFDGQDVLESGFAGPGRVQSGWLNRALEALPRGERVVSGLADRADHAAGAARCRADRRLGPGQPAAGRRGYRRSPHGALSRTAIPRWRTALTQGLQLDKAAHGRRHEAEAAAPTAPARCSWWRAARPG